MNLKSDFVVKTTTEMQHYQTSHVAPLVIPDNDSIHYASVNSSATTVEYQLIRPGNVSYSHAARNSSNVSSPTVRQQRNEASKTLIMGDSILSKINKKGLKTMLK